MDDEMDLQGVPEGALVLHCPNLLSREHRARLAEVLEQKLPGRALIIVDGGARLEALDNTQALKRIEGKLDMLLQALADEVGEAPEQPEPSKTLDGQLMGLARDMTRPL